MDVVLIGMGMVAQAHLLSLRDTDKDLRLRAVIGRDKNRTAAFCKQAGGVLGYEVAPSTDLATLATTPDMAIVITPPDARISYAEALAEARIPTLIEKPIERTLAAARTIVGHYARTGTTLGLCFQHRSREAARNLKGQIDSGDLGEIVHVDIRVPWWRDQAYYDAPGRGTYARDGGGVMINQAIHSLDLALWLAGPVARVQAQMRTSPLHRMEAEDIAAALLTFQSGASGVLSATTAAYPGDVESISLTTTRAQVTLQGDSLRINWHDGRQDMFTPDSDAATGGGADPMAFSHAWHQTVIEDFADAVSTGANPMAPPTEALHVHAVIHAMEQAARRGRIMDVSE